MFCGAGQYNYARECVEILIKWKYEMRDTPCHACEKDWFFKQYGQVDRGIAADLYPGQYSFWVKVRLNVYHAPGRKHSRKKKDKFHCTHIQRSAKRLGSSVNMSDSQAEGNKTTY